MRETTWRGRRLQVCETCGWTAVTALDHRPREHDCNDNGTETGEWNTRGDMS